MSIQEIKDSCKMSDSLQENMEYMNNRFRVDENFDIIYRVIEIGGKQACFYLIDGFCKDEMMQKIMQYFLDLTPEEMPTSCVQMAKKCMPYVEVDLQNDWNQMEYSLLSGVLLLFIDGFDQCFLIDARTYPARSVEEPDKDKALRGSKDGFVETIVFNTALIRRRIRSSKLRMEMMNAGTSSKTDIVICYMEGRADSKMLDKLRTKIQNIDVDALTLNQESLAEQIVSLHWFNPFPKFRFTERPDTTASQILEGSIAILVDNSPSAMILPTTLLDITEEADDYYFPPITGTYLRVTRFLISVLNYIVTPLFLLFMLNQQWIPEAFAFIKVKETMNLPLIWQFLILELAIDGLRLAAVNTPNMLSTPLSVMAALVLGEFSVNSGWFNAEVMLYMAFIAIATYTQTNYEMGYAVKFFRIVTLIFTAWFGIWGFLAGILLFLVCLVTNRTFDKRGYLYPILPFSPRELFKRLIRKKE